MVRAMSGLPGPISSSEREPALDDLSGKWRILGFLAADGAGRLREEGPVALRDVCLSSSVLFQTSHLNFPTA